MEMGLLFTKHEIAAIKHTLGRDCVCWEAYGRVLDVFRSYLKVIFGHNLKIVKVVQ